MRMLKTKKRLLKENSILDALPEDIVSVVTAHRTSLGSNPAIPDINENPFLLGVTSRALEDAKSKVQDKLSETNDPHVEYGHTLRECMDLEQPIRNHLERLCANHVIRMFGVPEETVDLDVRIVDEVDLDSDIMKLDPEGGGLQEKDSRRIVHGRSHGTVKGLHERHAC